MICQNFLKYNYVFYWLLFTFLLVLYSLQLKEVTFTLGIHEDQNENPKEELLVALVIESMNFNE